jgi:hypothetical protein
MKILSSTLLALTFAMSISSTASARSMPGIGGQSYYPSDNACFFPQSGWAGVTNSCNSTRTFVIPLENTLTSTGSITIKANSGLTCPAPPAICVGAFAVCTAYQVNAAGGLVLQKTATVMGNNVTIGTFPSVTATDTLHLVCDVPGTNSANRYGIKSVTW